MKIKNYILEFKSAKLIETVQPLSMLNFKGLNQFVFHSDRYFFRYVVDSSSNMKNYHAFLGSK